MACKCYYNPSLCAYTTTAQDVTAGATLEFVNNKILTGVAIQHTAGSSTVTINKAGVYFVSVDADVEPDAASQMTVQVFNNGVAIPDAIATFTGVADSVFHVHIDTLIKVLPSCCMVDNTVNLTVVAGAAASVTNAKIIVL